MSLRKSANEIQRLIKAFEKEADTFHDISFKIFFVDLEIAPFKDKFSSANHAIPLWQYYGSITNEEESERFSQDLTNPDPRFGIRGAELSLFAVIEGPATPLFTRMAKRAGSIFTRKEVENFRLRLLDDIIVKAANKNSKSLTVGNVNINPLAIWLSYLLYFLSLPQKKFIGLVAIEPDPFTLSLLALEGLLVKSEITRSDRSDNSVMDTYFRVALTFSGNHRKFVSAVADSLRRRLGKGSLFYDLDYQSQLARPNLDTLLQDIYQNRSDLIVVFLSAEYQESKWCGIEWRAIREIIMMRQSDHVMFIRFDDAKIDGVFSNDGYIDARIYDESAVAKLILSRLDSMEKELKYVDPAI